MKATMFLWYTNPVLRKCISELKWIRETYEYMNDIDNPAALIKTSNSRVFHNFQNMFDQRRCEQIWDFIEKQDLSFREKDEAKERLRVILGINEFCYDDYEQFTGDVADDLKEKFKPAADHCKKQYENPKQAIVTSNDVVNEYVVYLTKKIIRRFEDEDELICILERVENRSDSEIRTDSEGDSD